MKSAVEFSDYLKEPCEIVRNVLMGATLCSEIGGKFCAGRIVELELYMGACDRACHAFPNKMTPRNAAMFGPGGRAYVYFVYGMHHMFNVVIGAAGQPNAILVRALAPVAGMDVMASRRGTNDMRRLCSGPAKLTAALGITAGHDKLDLTRGREIWIEPRRGGPPEVAVGRRIGVDFAGADAALPWRFAEKGSVFVSRPI
jgi:DNA-3-methyladenine glycosylase